MHNPPPLVDSHVHLSMSGTIDKRARQQQLWAGYQESACFITRHIHYNFTHGVLGMRDGGDGKGHVLQYKNENMGDKENPVVLKTSGRAWHQKDRYGSMLGRHPGKNESLSTAYSEDYDPIDQVKLINSGPNSLKTFSREIPPQFCSEEIKKKLPRLYNKGEK
ncbi:MAG: hypothetical protein OEM01_01660 [Desulfobulbaceae bacterium]|nr:hypothetical protein [Desulfobulbaceae bacterium]